MTDAPTTPEVNPEPQDGTEVDTQPTETFDKAYVEKLRAEAAKYRTKLREREDAEKAAAEAKKQAELTLEERVKQAEAKAQDAMTAAETRVQTAERRASLAGKVANPERVMRLMDDVSDYFEGSEPKLDAILAAFPEYAPNQRPVAPAPDGAPAGASARQTTAASLQERLKNARTREERVSLQRQLQQAQKG